MFNFNLHLKIPVHCFHMFIKTLHCIFIFFKQSFQISPNIQALDILEVQKPVQKDSGGDCDQPCSKCTAFTIPNMLNNIQSSNANNSVNLCTLSNDNIAHIETCTSEQSDSKMWHELRKGRLTASNFSKVCKAVDANKCHAPSLHKTILGEYGEIPAPSLVWGKKKESAALQHCMRVCQKSHVHPLLSHRGLRIHSTMNFIGCSIDGLLTCKCHGSTIIEVKCPFTYRDEDPKDICLKKGCVINEKGEIVVTENSEYYHQIQGQMGIYGIYQCNIIFYTKKGICVAHADFNPDFFSKNAQQT